jgi:hypothetical protein
MSTLRHAAALAALSVAVAPIARAAAQDTPAGVRPYRFTVEGYLSTMSLDRGGDASRASIGGYGARLMFNRSDPAEALRNVFRRASFGVFTTFTAEQNGFSTQHFGVQADVPMFPFAVARGTLDPFVSLGAGGLRASPEVGDAETNFVLTPAIGTRIPFPGGFGFRGDLRAPVVFGSDTRINPVAEGGIYISF